MAEIILAVDEVAATKLLHSAETALGTISTGPGGGNLGPFSASWSASASFSGGTINLISPNIIRIADCNLNYSLNFTLTVDLNSILPNFCLPRVCIWTPFGDICTPKICLELADHSYPSQLFRYYNFYSRFYTERTLEWVKLAG